ncbi:MAG: Abortive infection protein, partial [Phenylobacterium sp.]|nr:Abortive infection protein [Phenylobacterium sp.]
FRGYLLQQTAALTKRTWLVIAINAVVFALFHLEFDPVALAARALAGAAFAWAALRLGGLEFAIGAHVATNLMLALIQAPMLPEDPRVAGDFDDVLGEVGLALYMVWAVEITRRMPRFMGPISSPA